MKTIILLLAAAVALEGKRYRSDYVDYPDAGGWLKLHRVPADWHEARLRCHLEGGTLASPLTRALARVLASIVQDHKLGCGVFTGISATFSRGDFASVEGTPLVRIPHRWAPGEPDNADDAEQCLVLLPEETLADARCADTFPYICRRQYTSQILNACGTFDNEYQLDVRTGSCYKFHLVPRPWARAHMACAAEGGHLAVANSPAEAAVLAELFAKHPPARLQSRAPFGKDIVFIGFHDWNEHGEWLTVQGQTLEQAGYSTWSGGQPDNATHAEHRGEACGALFRSGQLDDLWCGMPYHFICEKAPDSLLCDDQ